MFVLFFFNVLIIKYRCLCTNVKSKSKGIWKILKYNTYAWMCYKGKGTKYLYFVTSCLWARNRFSSPRSSLIVHFLIWNCHFLTSFTMSLLRLRLRVITSPACYYLRIDKCLREICRAREKKEGSLKWSDISTFHPLHTHFSLSLCLVHKTKSLLIHAPQISVEEVKEAGRGWWRRRDGGPLFLVLQCGASTPPGRMTHGGRASKHPSRFTAPGNPDQDRVSRVAPLLSGSVPPILWLRARVHFF